MTSVGSHYFLYKREGFVCEDRIRFSRHLVGDEHQALQSLENRGFTEHSKLNEELLEYMIVTFSCYNNNMQLQMQPYFS